MIYREATFDQLDTTTLYAILRLRSEVFVTEQDCPYTDPDGRDLEPTCRHVWYESDHGGAPATYLRLLDDGEGVQRIGRVATAPAHRRQGLAAKLMQEVLDRHPGPTVLDAQSYVQDFYIRLGFAVTGPEFLDDGIPHVPMRRE